jgi:hypothetical protein
VGIKGGARQYQLLGERFDAVGPFLGTGPLEAPVAVQWDRPADEAVGTIVKLATLLIDLPE